MKILIELSKESPEIYDFAQLLVKDFPYSIKQATVIPDSEYITPEQDEAKLIHDVCPKCGNADVIWTCYCNECKEAH